MPKTNFLFFLNAYNDLCQTSAPALNQFKWSREINGVPYTLQNSQQIQVPVSTTTSNILPYTFSTVLASPTVTITSGSNALASPSSTTNISIDQLIIGSGIPLGTVVSAVGGPYTFTVSSANATIGAVYSNNSQTFIVTSTIVAGTTLTASGAVAPLNSGTLTLVSGTGDATITFSSVLSTVTMSKNATSSATETLSFYEPASFIYLEADQQVSVIYNGGSPIVLNPFEINGATFPAVFFINGPAYSLTVTNLSTTLANVFFASMG